MSERLFLLQMGSFGEMPLNAKTLEEAQREVEWAYANTGRRTIVERVLEPAYEHYHTVDTDYRNKWKDTK